jgi:predicted permease
MMQDLRFTIRALRRRPLPSILASTCLAIGLGINGALFSAVDAILFRSPPGLSEPERLARIRIGAAGNAVSRGSGPAISYPQYEAIRNQRKREIPVLAAYAYREMGAGRGIDTQMLNAVFATTNYFDVLGARPHVGRFFDESEYANPVAVISYDFWNRGFDGRKDIVGQLLDTPGGRLTVIGVTAKRFVGADFGVADAWLPIGLAFSDAFGLSRARSEQVHWLQLIGRLADGLTPARLNAALATTEVNPNDDRFPISALPLRTMFFGDQRGQNPIPIWIFGIALSVLLLACGTVANLLMAQAAGRGSEMSVRMALGATRPQLIRQLILENVILAAIAAFLALVFAFWTSSLFRYLPLPPLPGIVGWRTIIFVALLSLTTVVFFGLAPAGWLLKRDVVELLKTRGTRTAQGATTIQRGLLITQIAISFALLVCATLFLVSLRSVQAIDTGMEMDRVVAATIHRSTIRSSRDLLRRDPRIEAVASGAIVPFYSFARYSFAIRDGRTDEFQPRGVLTNTVDSDFAQVMGLNIVEGRWFSDLDNEQSPPVAAVSQRLAQRLWPNSSGLGACLESMHLKSACIAVVGIVADVKYEDLQGPPSEVVYLAAPQAPALMGRTIFVRTRVRATDAVELIRTSLQAIQPTGVFVRAAPLTDRLRPQRLAWEVSARLFTIFGVLATVLSAIGLFTVVAFVVAQRTREFGIRVAIGAAKFDIIRLVLGSAMTMTLMGLFAGFVCAASVSQVLRNKIVGVSVVDLRVYLGVGLMLLAVSIAASVIPAYWAARSDPNISLRAE